MDRLSYNKDQQYVVFDFETECLSLINNQIWQVAAALYRGERLVEEYEAYVWHEDLNMSADAARITRFDYDYYKSRARPEEEVFVKVQSLLEDEKNVILGHNVASFDLPVYRLWAKNLNKWNGWGSIPNRMIDSLLLSRIYNDNRLPEGELYSAQMREVGKQYKAKKANLSAMARSFGIEVDENKTHDALYDTKINFQVFNKLKYHLKL